jgi:hypothetical protein
MMTQPQMQARRIQLGLKNLHMELRPPYLKPQQEIGHGLILVWATILPAPQRMRRMQIYGIPTARLQLLKSISQYHLQTITALELELRCPF